MGRDHASGRTGQVRAIGAQTARRPQRMNRSAEHEHDDDRHYADALASVRHAIEQFDGCSDEEKQALSQELAELQAMAAKLVSGRVEIVLFGEIDTGKSALINALVGAQVAQVDVRGGWTRDIWHV